MNIPNVPPAAIQPGHAELIIIFLIIVISLLVTAYCNEKKKNSSDATVWRDRIETKLDLAISSHDTCQKELPYKFVGRDEFRDLLSERNSQWKKFNEKFEKLLTNFLSHSHSGSGKVEKQDS